MQDTALSTRHNIYGAITVKILRAMKEAKGTYIMPWHSGTTPLSVPINALTDHPYRGVNILSLWIDGMTKGYPTGYWASYKQWQTLGAQVRYEQHGSLIIFYKKVDQTAMEKAAGELPRYVGKASWVFNAAQVENWTPPDLKRPAAVEIDRMVALFADAVGANVGHGYQRACYRTDLDSIEMPSPAWFFDTPTRTAVQAYHGVLFHELTHYADLRIMPHRCAFPRTGVQSRRGMSA